ncbi:hypothetical protein CHLRE_02g141004v5 [Chlamydomonas reinhardtii]|uniref:Uncharacterized protein n=1 Tax=Chlamydomonas reinhardtii TaxID=3055 RepID=A0A2K3E463_CHLRE|nr:uncharacterized protein CHLRE_02g141004v5 [Chlamydomonas reinhardtii]PNW87566.1 hypothetical protein CHLRE_02g141004v5 [Chlamydomonas reinhardtii]
MGFWVQSYDPSKWPVSVGRGSQEVLHRLNLPYTGANAAFYEPSKIETISVPVMLFLPL